MIGVTPNSVRDLLDLAYDHAFRRDVTADAEHDVVVYHSIKFYARRDAERERMGSSNAYSPVYLSTQAERLAKMIRGIARVRCLNPSLANFMDVVERTSGPDVPTDKSGNRFRKSVLFMVADYAWYRCAACGTDSALARQCSRCKRASYCNERCQRSHWAAHREKCKAVSLNASSSRDDQKEKKPFN